LFENEPIKKDSFIVAPTILKSLANEHAAAYIVYPNVESITSFVLAPLMVKSFHIQKENLAGKIEMLN